MLYQYIVKTAVRYARPLSQSMLALIGVSLHTVSAAHIAQQKSRPTEANESRYSPNTSILENAFQGYFTSAIDAVVDASNRFNPSSIAEDREYMGVVLRQRTSSELGDVYTYTVTPGMRGSETVTIKLAIPKNTEIVAFWHTHGKAHWSRRYFSEVDTAVANKWGVPFYLADYTGKLKVYEPGGKLLSPFKAKKMGLGMHRGYSKGRVVKHAETGLSYRINTLEQGVVTLTKAHPGSS